MVAGGRAAKPPVKLRPPSGNAVKHFSNAKRQRAVLASNAKRQRAVLAIRARRSLTLRVIDENPRKRGKNASQRWSSGSARPSTGTARAWYEEVRHLGGCNNHLLLRHPHIGCFDFRPTSGATLELTKMPARRRGVEFHPNRGETRGCLGEMLFRQFSISELGRE
jgi:hypothetical protein